MDNLYENCYNDGYDRLGKMAPLRRSYCGGCTKTVKKSQVPFSEHYYNMFDAYDTKKFGGGKEVVVDDPPQKNFVPSTSKEIMRIAQFKNPYYATPDNYELCNR